MASVPYTDVNAVPRPRSAIQDIDSPALTVEELRTEVKRLQGDCDRLLYAAAQYSGRTVSNARLQILGYTSEE